MVYFIIALIFVFVTQFIYDKYILDQGIRNEGGIRVKYRELVDFLSNGPRQNINVFDKGHHLDIVITTATIKTVYTLTPGFDALSVKLLMEYGKFGSIENSWNFNTQRYSQRDMISAIIDYTKNAHHNLQTSILERQVDEPSNNSVEGSIKEAGDKLIIPGNGIDGIEINRTTAIEIEGKYGTNYDSITHNNFSLEMHYQELGVSLFYKLSDPKKTIFIIRLWEKFGGYTMDGLLLNKNLSVADIFRVYGKVSDFSTSKSSDYAYLAYEGIMFYVTKKDAYSIPSHLIKIDSIGIY